MVGRNIDLSEQVTIVTGASRGIGAAIARGLASYGALVTIADLGKQKNEAEKVVQAIKDDGSSAYWHEVDVTKPYSIYALVQAVVQRHGRLDIMMNNAGILVRKPAVELTPEEWDAQHNVNLRGVFFGCQAAAKQMMKQENGGKIINTASELAFVVPKSNISATYLASKGGVANLTRALAVEWAPYKIRVNALGPGPTNTYMLATTLADPARYSATVAEIPLGRIQEPEDMVGAVAFLASNLSSMITGQVLLVDGGRTLV